MTDPRKMYVSRSDRLDLSVSFTGGDCEVEFDSGLVSEYLEVVERYEVLMGKLWVLKEGVRIQAILDQDEEDHA